MAPVIEHFETAFDREEADKHGRIVPHEGVDSSFDEADAAVNTATEGLDEYLDKLRKKFGSSNEVGPVCKLGLYMTDTLSSFEAPCSTKENLMIPLNLLSSKAMVLNCPVCAFNFRSIM
jgi:hypothetical protein